MSESSSIEHSMGSDLLATTFPSRPALERAVECLTRLGADFRIIEPTAPLALVAIPALVMTREVRSALLRATSVPVFSGWVDYRSTKASMPVGPEPDANGLCFKRASIVVLQPCIADEEKIRLVADLEGDLSPVLPYLNAVMRHASYTPANDAMTYMEGQKLIVLYPKRVTMAKADEIVDAWVALDRIRRLTEQTWANREQIQPCFETRKEPPALEIFKRLPGTDCGLCGEMTCMAFALRLWSGQVSLRQCGPLFEPSGEARRLALLEIVAGLGLDDAGIARGEMTR